MDLPERFHKALLADSEAQSGDPVLLPVKLVRAVVAVLPVDGAGLGVHGEPHLRTPLAASDQTFSLAERLQFTVGCGPCLHAVESGRPLVASEGDLAERWPVFHDLLVAQTPIRSVLAWPLGGPLLGAGVLSLYWRDPAGSVAVREHDVQRVAALISGELAHAADWSRWTGNSLPVVLDTPDARHRGRLWMATGMVMLALRMRAEDALALLRGHAYATGGTVDDLATELVERRLRPDQLVGEGPARR